MGCQEKVRSLSTFYISHKTQQDYDFPALVGVHVSCYMAIIKVSLFPSMSLFLSVYSTRYSLHRGCMAPTSGFVMTVAIRRYKILLQKYSPSDAQRYIQYTATVKNLKYQNVTELTIFPFTLFNVNSLHCVYGCLLFTNVRYNPPLNHTSSVLQTITFNHT